MLASLVSTTFTKKATNLQERVELNSKKKKKKTGAKVQKLEKKNKKKNIKKKKKKYIFENIKIEISL